MNKYLKPCLFSALTLVACNSYAALITGTIQYVGISAPTGGTSLADATGLSFPNSVGNEGTILIKDGLLATLITDNIIDLYDFAFDPLASGGSMVWNDTESGISFLLTDVTLIDQSSSFLNLSGSGVLTGGDYEDTIAKWDLSTQSVDNNGGATITFSASTSTANIPEPASLGILGLGLIGLGFVRKQKKS